MRHEVGDPTIGTAVAEAFRRIAKTGSKKQPLMQRLSQLESWNLTPPRYQGELLEAAVKAESHSDLRQQFQDALRFFPPPPRPPESQPGQARPGIVEGIPPRVESRMSPVLAAEWPTAGASEIPSQLPLRAEVIPEVSLPTPADPEMVSVSSIAAISPTPFGGEEVTDASRRPPAPPLASVGEGRPTDDRVPNTATAEGPKGESAPADTDAQEPEPPQKSRSSRPIKGDAASTPADHGDPARQVAELLNQYLPNLAALPRVATQLSALTGEVRELGGRPPRPDERAGELASIREELRRTRDELRERQRSLDEALRERDRLQSENQDTAARIQEAQKRIKLAEDRADQHIHLANQDRENSIQNYLAELQPTLRRLLIDVGDQPQEDGANPQSETESLLWRRLSEIKRALKDRGVLLD
jgi:hypothetical protein